jgi:hypothetical protein
MFLVGGDPLSASKAWDGSLNHRMLEEELDLQLNLLQEHEYHVRPNQFPQVEVPMQELPHLMDNTFSTHDQVQIENAQVANMFTTIEGNTLETVAVCLAIAALCFAPQILNL